MAGRGAELDALFEDPGRHPTDWKGFAAYSARVWEGVEATARRITSAALGRRVRAPWMPGRYTARDAFLQATLEEGHHLGEVIGALWQEDRAPPEMTWMGVRRDADRTKGRR